MSACKPVGKWGPAEHKSAVVRIGNEKREVRVASGDDLPVVRADCTIN